MVNLSITREARTCNEEKTFSSKSGLGKTEQMPIKEVKIKTFSNTISSAQSYLTICDPMDCTTPGLPVHHQLPELTQTHVH